MPEGFVSRDEMLAHIDPMRDDIREIKTDVKALVADRYSNSFFGGRGQAWLLAVIPAVIATVIGVLIAVLFP